MDYRPRTIDFTGDQYVVFNNSATMDHRLSTIDFSVARFIVIGPQSMANASFENPTELHSIHLQRRQAGHTRISSG